MARWEGYVAGVIEVVRGEALSPKIRFNEDTPSNRHHTRRFRGPSILMSVLGNRSGGEVLGLAYPATGDLPSC